MSGETVGAPKCCMGLAFPVAATGDLPERGSGYDRDGLERYATPPYFCAPRVGIYVGWVCSGSARLFDAALYVGHFEVEAGVGCGDWERLAWILCFAMFTLSLLHSVLEFLGYFAMACPLGVLSYGVIVRTRDKTQENLIASALLLLALPTLVLLVIALPALIVLFLLCSGPAYLEKRLHDDQFDWLRYCWTLVLATYISLLVGVGLAVIAITSNFVSYNDTLWCGIIAGLGLTPPSLSVFQWIWHTSKLRLGFDVPFEQDELK